MKILRVALNGQWLGARFEGGRFLDALDTRLNWMKGLALPEIMEILKARGAKLRWVDLDAEVKRAPRV